jgi:hydrogenase-4 component B
MLACGLTGLAFIGILAVLCFTKVFSICFLGLPRVPHQEKLSEGSAFMLTPMIILGVSIVVIGFFPLLALPLLKNVVGQFVPGFASAGWDNMMALFGRLSLAMVILGGLILFFMTMRRMLLRGKEVTIFKTWDCGYQEASSRMSYTGSSFAAPFMHLVAPFIPQKITVKQPQGLFPKDALYESYHDDFIAFYLIKPLNVAILWCMGLFTWMQSGRTQHYILYGLIFLIILIIWIIGVS